MTDDIDTLREAACSLVDSYEYGSKQEVDQKMRTLAALAGWNGTFVSREFAT
jgi:hypothetical protein